MTDQLDLFDVPALPARHERGTVAEDQPTVCSTSDDQFVVVKYEFRPRTGVGDWVFPMFWCGPDSTVWRGTGGAIGHVPRDAHRFTDLAAAREAATRVARGEL